MDQRLIPIQVVSKFAVERVPALPEEPDRVAIGLEDREGRRAAYELEDVRCYELIRAMTDVLFAVED